MDKHKVVIINLLLIGLVITSLSLSPMLTRIVKADGSSVNRGYVIASGQLLSKPYEVSINGNKVYINDTQFYPLPSETSHRKLSPTDAFNTLKVTEKDQTQIDKIAQIEQKVPELYNKWIKQYRSDTVLNKIKGWLEERDFVSSVSLGSNSVEYIYKNGHNGAFLISSETSNGVSAQSASHATLSQTASRVRKLLKRGGLLIFGGG